MQLAMLSNFSPCFGENSLYQIKVISFGSEPGIILPKIYLNENVVEPGEDLEIHGKLECCVFEYDGEYIEFKGIWALVIGYKLISQ